MDFKASSSLREDEIMSIVRYSSRGFVPAISTYNLARNHVFYNVVSSLDSRRESPPCPSVRAWFLSSLFSDRWLF